MYYLLMSDLIWYGVSRDGQPGCSPLLAPINRLIANDPLEKTDGRISKGGDFAYSQESFPMTASYERCSAKHAL